MKKAIVIGAGVAGLAAAKVLSEFFDRVEVYHGATPPQTHHLHVLLKSGQDALERIFPGIRTRLLENTCPIIDWARDTVWEYQSGTFPRYSSKVAALSLSRSLLVSIMRQMIDESRVTFIEENITGLQSLEASLVVVAAGQNFPLARFLGSEVVVEKKYDINLTYRSLIFSRDEISMEDFKQYYYQLNASQMSMGGVISQIEGNRVIATLIQREEQVSECRGLEDFLKKAQEIPSGLFTSILKDAKALSELHTCRKKSTHYRKLNLEKLPENVIVMGDGLLSLNPIFGQGMTVALNQSLVLKEMLTCEKFNSKRFQRRCAKKSILPYQLSYFGSQQTGLGKLFLQVYLVLCQRSNLLHHFFLKQLHTLKLFPVGSR